MTVATHPRVLAIGEVLWDIIRGQEHIGGAPFNLAAHLARLGCAASILTRIGADLTARYVAFHGNDDYMECIDMASALHPQTILATKYAGEPITDPYGAPLRLRTAVKLGYKNAKWS